jgi:CRISPR-associated protein Csb2
MNALFRISVHFLQPLCHARGNGDVPEWPPSPLRVFQAFVAAAAARWNERQSLVFAGPALRWFELLPPPEIRAVSGQPALLSYRLYVPDNVADKVAACWSRNREGSIAEYRSEKDVRPTLLEDDSTVHYIYPFDQSPSDVSQHLDVLTLAARSMTHLGWGIDMIACDADRIDPADADALAGERWTASQSGPNLLRCPRRGTLDQLLLKHHAFLKRVELGSDDELTFNPVPSISAYRSFSYRRSTDPLPRPYAVFKLVDLNEDTYRHPHSLLMKIAGMVRHVGIAAMKRNPPRGLSASATWVERYVAGHRDEADHAVDLPHAQLSYVPLPSTGHPHADPGIRRVMIVAPIDDDDILGHLVRQLDGIQLKPESTGDLPGPVFLQHVRNDNIARYYTRPSRVWSSFTPVILPGHDDHKPDKTRKLIEKALAQSGVDQPCEFEWSAFSRFPKSYSAHKYKRDAMDKEKKHPAGYLRPGHLLNQTAVHLTIRFENEVPGPITLGAGRHCGFGLFAGVDR